MNFKLFKIIYFDLDKEYCRERMMLCILAGIILVLSSLVPGQEADGVLNAAAGGPDCQAFASPGQLMDVSETQITDKERILINLLACLKIKKSMDINRLYFRLLVRYSKENSKLMKRTGLMLAAEAGLSNIAKDFLYLQPDVSIRDVYGYSAAILAGKNGNVDILNIILEAGVDKNDKTNSKETVLLHAAKNGHSLPTTKACRHQCADNCRMDCINRGC